MPKAYFVVRAVVEEPSREKFDHWYATDHLPEALAGLRPEKGWRLWSAREAGVHYAVYRFADMAKPRRGAQIGSLQGACRRFRPLMAGCYAHARRARPGAGSGRLTRVQA
jgi:hypothetical protein